MLVFNQQANIKNVNGAIADIFANRPAPQSTFYIFYSTDTQEIFYDNGAWILIGSGGGGVNIYNSDGTLTGNRTLSGANNDLNLADLNIFKTSIGGNDIGLKLDFANNSYSIGDISNMTMVYLKSDGEYAVMYNGNRIIDANQQLKIISFGDCPETGNKTNFNINDLSQIIKTRNQGNDIGLILDFANNFFGIGNNFQDILFYIDNNFKTIISQFNGNIEGLKLDFIQRTYEFGNLDLNFNRTIFTIDDTLQLIKTKNQGNDIGLKLDFANNIYSFGKFNENYLKIDVLNGLIDLGFDSSQILFRVDNINVNVKIGDFNAFNNQTFLLIDDLNGLIKTSYQGNDIGLKLDFANSLYQFGQITGGNQSIFKIDDTTQIVNIQKSGIDGGIEVNLSNNWVRLGDWFSLHGGHKIDIVSSDITMTAGGINTPGFRINSQIDFIATYFQSNINGINLDFANRNYYFGQSTGNNRTVLIVDDTNEIINTFSQNNNIGLNLDFANTTYQLGQLTGGNTTYLTINDSATYPLQIDGTNVLSGTSGSTSGQHLKIKINGVDYKIELKNP